VKAQEKRQIGQILERKKSDTVHIARSVILLFLLWTDYKVFLIINLQDCSAYSGLHSGIFFEFFRSFEI
jgi:hypothetical protein